MDITSVQNSTIKYIRQLHQKKYRDQSGHFLIEGLKLVNEASQAGLVLEEILATEPSGLSMELKSRCLTVTEPVMQAATTLKSPPQVMAIAHQFERDLRLEQAQLLLVSEGVQDPGNFGALLRLAEAFGTNAVICVGEHVDRFHPRVLRGAMGAVFRLPVIHWDWLQLQALLPQGWQMVATSSHGGIPLPQFGFSERTCLLLGSEGQGLSAEMAALATTQVTIPLAPPVESLNVATATAVILYAYQRQQEHPQ